MLKKIFLKSVKRAGSLIFLTFLVVFGLLLPLQSAHAALDLLFTIGKIFGFVGFIIEKGIILTIDKLIGVVFFLPLLAGNIVFALAILLFTIVTDPDFITISYTGMDNPVIAAGWPLMRNLANIIIVLTLLVIGLATMLRIEEYRAQKLLVPLVIVALLVNFSPVITGLIIDAGNILMRELLKDLTGWAGFMNFLKNEARLSVFDNVVTSISRPGEATGQMIALTIYSWLGGIIMIIFAFLFFVRYIALWIFVVLSPLAFVCYILPATKRFFSLWWSQFIQWNFVGITLAFFLFLAHSLLSFLQRDASRVFGSGLGGGFWGTFFVYMTVVVLLYIGFTVGLATSAYGASSVINASKRAQKWVGERVGKSVGRLAEEKLRVREGVGKVTGAIEKMPTKYGGGALRTFMPEAMRKYAEFGPAIEKSKQETAPYSSQVIANRIAAGADYGVKAVGGLMTLAERGSMQALLEAYMDKYKAGTEADLYKIPALRNKMARLLKLAMRAGSHNDILRSDPRLARFAFGQLDDYSESALKQFAPPGQKVTEAEAVIKATMEARRPHIGHWGNDVINDEEVIRAGLTKGTEFWSAIDAQVKQGQETALKTIDKMFTDFINTRKLAHATQTDIDAAWKTWEREFQARFPGMKGYFEALRIDARFKARGWRRGNYVAPEAAPPGGAPPPVPSGGTPGVGGATPHTAGGTTGIVSAPPPTGRPGIGGLPATTPGAAAGLVPSPPKGRPRIGVTPFEKVIRQKQARGETLSKNEQDYLRSIERRRRPRGRFKRGES